MLFDDIQVGMKVTPKNKSCGMNLNEWLYCNNDSAKFLKENGYLIVVQKEPNKEVVLSHIDKLTFVGGHFLAEDIEPAQDNPVPYPIQMTVDIKAIQKGSSVRALVRDNQTGSYYVGRADYDKEKEEVFFEVVKRAVCDALNQAT